MKWKNGDINVVKQTNIPKFSKTCNVGTPLRLFVKSFFDGVLVDMIVGQPSCTVIERKQTLVLKLLMKHFVYS